jgi:multiple sugar transport system substrate-binding protein
MGDVLNRLKSWGRVAIATLGVMLMLWLVIFVRPDRPEVGERTEIKLWSVTGSEDIDPPGPKWFNESQDAIYLRPVGLPFMEIEQKFLTAAVGNIPPDLFEYFGSVAQWSTRGALMPLDEFMERDGFDRSQIFDALWEEMMWEGRTFAIPTGTANEAFYWNKAHFRAAGLDPDRPPRTWAELEEYALRLTKYNADGTIDRAGYIPGYWSPFGNPLYLNWPVQLGAKFLSEDGTRVILTAPANVKALEWEGKLFERLGRQALIAKRASYGYGTQHGFLGGNLSMIVQKSSFIQELDKFAPDLEYGVAPLPVPSEGMYGVIAGSVWIGIPAGAKNPEEAWEFIKFYTSSDVQSLVAQWGAEQQLASFFPANVEAANSPAARSSKHSEVFVKSMEWAHTSTVVPLAHTQFWRSYSEAWDRVMRGTQTADEALQQAEREVQRALDANIEYSRFYRERLERMARRAGRDPDGRKS